MALTKYKFGQLIELTTETNSNNLFGPADVRGVTITKQIIPTKADVSETDLSNFLVIRPEQFVLNPRTHGKHIGFGYNNSNTSFIISWNNIGFRIREEMKEVISPTYLFLHFNRNEWDREACYQSWGSSTEVFTWETLCDMELEVPALPVQQKYVDVYNALIANQQSYARGIEDLKLVCEGYIEDLRKKLGTEPIGKYLSQKNDRNTDKSNDYVVGLSTKKLFREAQSRVNRDELGNYKIVRPDEIAFVPTTDTWKVLAFAQNTFGRDVVVSPVYEVFSVDKNVLLPEYLSMWLARKEFDRYARYNSWGSARENFTWEDMTEIKIPVPDIGVQKAIVNIYKVYVERKRINEQLKAQIKDICPVLIKGSLEASK